jgi:hypothetical protein
MTVANHEERESGLIGLDAVRRQLLHQPPGAALGRGLTRLGQAFSLSVAALMLCFDLVRLNTHDKWVDLITLALPMR